MNNLHNIRLQYAAWKDLPPNYQGFFIEMMGADTRRGQSFYETYFYGYNIAHEIGHMLRWLYGSRTEQQYVEETSCNQFAVAYWHARLANHLLVQLAADIAFGLAYLPDPTPPGEDRVDYFNHHQQELIEPKKYGHYQWTMVQEALRHPLTLSDGLRTLITPQIEQYNAPLIPFDPDIRIDLPGETINDIRDTLACYGVVVPEIAAVCEFAPQLQFLIADE